jgi:hypothetical protein
MSKALPKTSSTSSTAAQDPPGARPLPTAKTSSATSAKSSRKKCSPKVWPAKLPLPTSNPPPHAPVQDVSNPWTAPRTIRASCKPGPARPPGPSRKAPAPAVGGLFFPQAKSLGLGQTETSPALQQKIVYAGSAGRSFAQASALLERLADRSVDAKQVERLPESIGAERVVERDAATAVVAALPLVEKFAAPPGGTPPGLAVVMADGGRLQILDRAAAAAPAAAADTLDARPQGADAPAPADPDWDEEPPPHKGHWREDKVGLLLTMARAVSAADPCPDLPASFLEVLRIPQRARPLKKNPRAGADAVAEADDPQEVEEVRQAETVCEPPEVVTRRVVASRVCWPSFAPQLAAAAWGLGFQGATRKAFVGDGSSHNWTRQRRFFGSFVPMLDCIHALSYVFAAAMAGRTFAAGWVGYQEWIAWVWQGKVSVVIAALQARQAELGLPGEEEPETSPAQVVSKTLSYLENHQEKMKYAAYRKEGLPITSSLMESAVKQINQRVKGSEKFWSEAGSEPVLQRRADQSSDGAVLEDFWERRQAEATGQRPYRRAA